DPKTEDPKPQEKHDGEDKPDWGNGFTGEKPLAVAPPELGIKFTAMIGDSIDSLWGLESKLKLGWVNDLVVNPLQALSMLGNAIPVVDKIPNPAAKLPQPVKSGLQALLTSTVGVRVAGQVEMGFGNEHIFLHGGRIFLDGEIDDLKKLQ